uniref:Secreted protein n=1 Tax=Steinernema glaseri TaxID=37863 RepID=A0A1I7Z681_9BILA
MIASAAVYSGFLLCPALLTHVLLGCRPKPKTTALSPAQPRIPKEHPKNVDSTTSGTPPSTTNNTPPPTKQQKILANKSTRVEKTVEIMIPDDIVRSNEYRDAQNEIKQSTDDGDSYKQKPLLVPTKE